MTPKEKAKEIIDKFIFIDNGEKFQIISMENEILAKQCALIAVDFAREFITGDLNEAFDKTMYLFEVKKEIEKL